MDRENNSLWQTITGDCKQRTPETVLGDSNRPEKGEFNAHIKKKVTLAKWKEMKSECRSKTGHAKHASQHYM